jgi:hypothetical protein
MNRGTARQAALGVGRELVTSSSIIRAIVGTIAAAFAIWRLGWSPWVLAVILLAYIAYALARRVWLLERELVEARNAVASDPNARRRRVRDGLASHVADLQRLMERMRPAFDAGAGSWDAFKGEATEAVRSAETFVATELGDAELSELRRQVPLHGIDSRRPDADYVVHHEVLSARKRQLEIFLERVPPAV